MLQLVFGLDSFVELSMKKLCVVSALCLMCACQATAVMAEGFAMTQWSARGLALAGGMVGRADDPSAIAYNAAGITLLPGTQVMGGIAGGFSKNVIDTYRASGEHTSTENNSSSIRFAPYAYLSHQLNERFWLGFGLFSRFGLDNAFPDDWPGRYDVVSTKLKTFSLVPTVAVKVNEHLSVSVGLEVMYASLTKVSQIPVYAYSSNVSPTKQEDNKMTLDGSNWGIGAHLGVHLRLSDKLYVGFSYKSPVTVNLDGGADFSRRTANMLADQGQVPHAIDTGTHTKIHLPDSFALGLTYRPQDNLSFEVGSVFTRWSAYDSLYTEFDSDFQLDEKREWDDGWNFNASVEYKPMDWLALRAGIWHETPVTNRAHPSFIVPGHGRTGVSVGTGFKWDNWRLDMGYAHVWIHGMNYNDVYTGDIKSASMESHDLSDNIFSASVSYVF